MEPKKILYTQQDRAVNEIIDYLQRVLKEEKGIKNAYIYGSVVSGEFGKYETVFTDDDKISHHGSEINLLVITSPLFIMPKSWRKLKAKRNGFDVFSMASFPFDDHMFDYRKTPHMIFAITSKDEKILKNLGKIRKVI